MVDQEMLEAMRKMMREEIQPINDRLEKAERLAAKTAVIIENNVAANISLLQENSVDIMRKLKELEGLPQAIGDIQSDVSVIKHVISSQGQEIKQLKAQ